MEFVEISWELDRKFIPSELIESIIFSELTSKGSIGEAVGVIEAFDYKFLLLRLFGEVVESKGL